MERFGSQYIFEHWVSCLRSDLENREDHVQLAKDIANKHQKWTLEKVSLDEILTFAGTVLEQSYFFKTRVNDYVLRAFNGSQLPPVILIPLDRNNRKVFLEEKYQNPKIKWEVADGYHRTTVARRLGQTSILSYIPVEETCSE